MKSFVIAALILQGCVQQTYEPHVISLPHSYSAPPVCYADDDRSKMNGAPGVRVDGREIIVTEPWLRKHQHGNHFGFSCYGPKQPGDLEVEYTR